MKMKPRPCYYLVLAVFVLSIVLYAKNFVVSETLVLLPEKAWGLLVGLGMVLFGVFAALISSYRDKRKI